MRREAEREAIFYNLNLCALLFWVTSGAFTQPRDELGCLRLSFQEKFSFSFLNRLLKGTQETILVREAEKIPEECRPIETEYGPHEGRGGRYLKYNTYVIDVSKLFLKEISSLINTKTQKGDFDIILESEVYLTNTYSAYQLGRAAGQALGSHVWQGHCVRQWSS